MEGRSLSQFAIMEQSKQLRGTRDRTEDHQSIRYVFLPCAYGLRHKIAYVPDAALCRLSVYSHPDPDTATSEHCYVDMLVLTAYLETKVMALDVNR